MKALEESLITLSKMFPNDMSFGSEVRKLVFELRRNRFKSRKEKWDELTTTEDFLRSMDNQ
mgnify:CR=1 FL=1